MSKIRLYNEETLIRKWLFAATLHEILARQYPETFIGDTNTKKSDDDCDYVLEGTEHLVHNNDGSLVYARSYLALSTSPESGINRRLNRFAKIVTSSKTNIITRMIFALAVECPRNCFSKVEEISNMLGNRGIQFEFWEAKDFRRQIQVHLGVTCPAFGLEHLMQLSSHIRLSCSLIELINQNKNPSLNFENKESKNRNDEPLDTLFVSYASEDRKFVENLLEKLDKFAAHVWYDQREILVGESIVEKVNAGLKNATVIVSILSKSSITKPWVLREMYSSFGRQLQSTQISVLPVVIDDCEIPPLMNDVKYADFRNSFETGFNQLIATLQGRRQRLYVIAK